MANPIRVTPESFFSVYHAYALGPHRDVWVGARSERAEEQELADNGKDDRHEEYDRRDGADEREGGEKDRHHEPRALIAGCGDGDRFRPCIWLQRCGKPRVSETNQPRGDEVESLSTHRAGAAGGALATRAVQRGL